jgi:hypothetical protein
MTGDRSERPQRPERPDVTPRPRAESRAAAKARMAQQHTWVDLQVRQAMERGDFDDLPGAGKPLKLDETHDPNWWLRKLVERENVAVLPPSLALRKEDAELDGTLDKLQTEADVRRHVTDFNERVVAARYRLPEGPPLVTMPRDVDAAVTAWLERRKVRLAEQRAKARQALAEQKAQPRERKRRWWRRG